MNTKKMKTDTLLILTDRIIDSVEKAISTSLELSNPKVCQKLEEELFYSFSYLRNIFKYTTNISLNKYITRRRYTNILLQMKSEDFYTLPLNKEIFKIQNFKRKCLNEFPKLSSIYSTEYMQLPIDKETLQESLDTQLYKEITGQRINSVFDNIMKNRNPIIIDNSQKNLLIQEENRILIDLDRSYFKFQDKVFKITATINLMQDEVEDPFFSLLFGQATYLSYSFPANANNIVHATNIFFSKNCTVSFGLSLTIEWGSENEWGSSALISSMSFKDNKLIDIKLVKHPFLLFDNQNVLIDLSFFERIYA